MVKKNSFLTPSEIQKALQESGIEVSKVTVKKSLNRAGLQSRSPRKTPLLKAKHVRDRLNYVRKYQRESENFWNLVIWSDEKKIEFFGRNMRTRVCRGKIWKFNL